MGNGILETQIADVRLLGCNEKLEWNRKSEGLQIIVPSNTVFENAICFELKLK